MTCVLAIPGAFSSPRIFQWIRQQLPDATWQFLEYSDIASSIADIQQKVRRKQCSCHVVGHSMGGLIALSLAHEPWVKTITTISAPIGGLDLNIFQMMFSRSSLMQELSSTGGFISALKKSLIDKPCQHVISTQGFNPWIYEPSDGVVTVRSQKAQAWGPQWEISANHCEVMLDDQTVELLRKFWQQHDSI